MNGVILWEGPSRFNGEPIVVIATGLVRESINPKTGPMIQVWILQQDVSPVDASHEGSDVAICGGCPLKRSIGGGCYVTLHQAPGQVWRQYKAGNYPKADSRGFMGLFAGRLVRLGAYGDCVATPFWLWSSVLRYAKGWTGYSHSWYREDAQDFKTLLMASVGSETEANQAHAMGWRSFRVRRPGESLATKEIECPASAEGGHRRTCSTCLACDGAQRGVRQASVAIIAHGHLASRF